MNSKHKSTRSRSRIVFKPGGKKITKTQLGRCVDDLRSIVLPDSYSDHMLRYNGGIPEPNYFVLQRTRAIRELCWIDQLWPVGQADINDVLGLVGANIRFALEAQHRGAPLGCITIGSVCSEEDLLLFCSGQRLGQIWLKSWAEVPEFDVNPRDELNPKVGLYKLASSFDEFLNMLMTVDKARTQIERHNARRK